MEWFTTTLLTSEWGEVHWCDSIVKLRLISKFDQFLTIQTFRLSDYITYQSKEELNYMVLLKFEEWLSKLCLQERVTEKRHALGSSQGVVPNWAWQIHNQVNATQLPLFSAAASSGFSFSAIPAAILPPRQPGSTAHNLHFTSAKASPNSPQLNPQQPPP